MFFAEHESRDEYKRSMSQILQKLSEAEAYFVKGEKCLQAVEKEAKRKCSIDGLGEIMTDAPVVEEIKSIINTLQGKDRMEGDRFL